MRSALPTFVRGAQLGLAALLMSCESPLEQLPPIVDTSCATDGDCLIGERCCDTVCSVGCAEDGELCGDGIRHWLEVCDDANTDNGDYCAGDCASITGACGDGLLQTNEVCDPTSVDPPLPSTECRADCRRPSCGDGVVDFGEECDDGNLVDTDSCRDSSTGGCKLPRCGDGVVDSGEDCDDGNGLNTDGCIDGPFGFCQDAACGDGWVRDGVEDCDDGNHHDDDACPDGPAGSCEAARCGDGLLWLGEETCDEGTNNSNSAANGCRTDCREAYCGDGVTDTGEACDDGNSVTTDACLPGCIAARCGDGFTRTGSEFCDDGNSIQTDACTNGCVVATCGDSIVRALVEACDDGNASETPCTNTCRLDTCGNGTPEGAEECDDGNSDDTDACLTVCLDASCGDGIVNNGESCDDGNRILSDLCPDGPLGTCEPAVCGDGILRPATEVCDDGTGDDTDDCTDDVGGCNLARCGDGFVWSGYETCDDANDDLTDSCPDGEDGSCVDAACGDGYVWASNEDCDDGNGSNEDACPDGAGGTCADASCGDGFVWDGVEDCDDTNGDDTDDCPSSCAAASCGDGYVWSGYEDCDDGDDNSDFLPDRCRSDCTPPSCGDFVIDSGEGCDDANGTNGDGCDNNCTPTGCGNGILTGSEECDDGNLAALDGCTSQCKLGAQTMTSFAAASPWVQATWDKREPETLYGLTSQGSVHVSYNAGSTWRALCTLPFFVTNDTSTALTVSPGPDRGAYVMRSASNFFRVTDRGGATCTQVNYPSNFSPYSYQYDSTERSGYARAQTNGELFLVGQNPGRLLRTRNAGGSFSEAAPFPGSNTAYSIAVHPTDERIRVISRNDGLWRTTDGVTYTLVTNSFTSTGLRFDPTNPARIYADSGWYSVNTGANWTQDSAYSIPGQTRIDSTGRGWTMRRTSGSISLETTPTYAPPAWTQVFVLSGENQYNRFDVVHDGDLGEARIALVALGRLYVSDDSGTTFVERPRQIRPMRATGFSAPGGSLVYAATTDGSLLVSSSTGTTWTAAYSEPYLASQHFRVFSHPSVPQQVIGFSQNWNGDYNSYRVFSDDGLASASTQSALQYSWSRVVATSPTDPDVFYVLGGDTRRSDNGGDTFVSASSSLWPNCCPYLLGATVDANDNDRVWVAEIYNGYEFWEYDWGSNTRSDIRNRLTAVTGSEFYPTSVEQYFDGDDWALRVTSAYGDLLVSTNGATTFARQGAVSPMGNCDQRTLRTHPEDPNTIVSFCRNNSSSHYVTRNGGVSWVDLTPQLGGCQVVDVAMTSTAVLLACANLQPVQFPLGGSSCGNGIIELPEGCDDGGSNSDATPNACRTTCKAAACGDDVIDTGETCDDGNLRNNDGCDANCRPTGCGNGQPTVSEDCDAGAFNSDVTPNLCRDACLGPSCGDGITDSGLLEECDDAGANDDTTPDACRTSCVLPRCGDGIVDTNEECDDQNTDDDDGCTNTCTLCGDGNVTSPEQCDDGSANSDTDPDTCRLNCRNPTCGDDVLDTGEVCDDGFAARGCRTCAADCSATFTLASGCELPLPPAVGAPNRCEYGLLCASWTQNGSQWTCTDAQMTRLATWANPAGPGKLTSRMTYWTWSNTQLQHVAAMHGFTSCAAQISSTRYTGYHIFNNTTQAAGYRVGSATPIDCGVLSSSPIALYDAQTGNWAFTSQPAACTTSPAPPTPPTGYLNECLWNYANYDTVTDIVCTE